MSAIHDDAIKKLAGQFDIHPARVTEIAKHAANAAMEGQGDEEKLQAELMNFGYVSDEELIFSGMVAGAMVVKIKDDPRFRKLMLLKKLLGDMI